MESKSWPSSTQISVTKYDKDKKLLIVTFKSNDTIYEYKEVPEEIWNKIKATDSIGSLFNKEIRNKFEYKKIS